MTPNIQLPTSGSVLQDNSYLVTHHSSLTDILEADPKLTMPYLYTYYHHIRKLWIEQPHTDSTQNTQSQTDILTSQYDTDLEVSDNEDDYGHKSFRPSSYPAAHSSDRVLRSSKKKYPDLKQIVSNRSRMTITWWTASKCLQSWMCNHTKPTLLHPCPYRTQDGNKVEQPGLRPQHFSPEQSCTDKNLKHNNINYQPTKFTKFWQAKAMMNKTT